MSTTTGTVWSGRDWTKPNESDPPAREPEADGSSHGDELEGSPGSPGGSIGASNR